MAAGSQRLQEARLVVVEAAGRGPPGEGRSYGREDARASPKGPWPSWRRLARQHTRLIEARLRVWVPERGRPLVAPAAATDAYVNLNGSTPCTGAGHEDLHQRGRNLRSSSVCPASGPRAVRIVEYRQAGRFRPSKTSWKCRASAVEVLRTRKSSSRSTDAVWGAAVCADLVRRFRRGHRCPGTAVAFSGDMASMRLATVAALVVAVRGRTPALVVACCWWPYPAAGGARKPIAGGRRAG